MEKLLSCIWPSCSTPAVLWNVLRQWKHQRQQKDLICFTPACWIHGNPIVVHAHEVNTVNYAIASIIGAGLHGEEITISFGKMIHQKIKARETGTTFPSSAEILSAVMKAKFKDFFN